MSSVGGLIGPRARYIASYWGGLGLLTWEVMRNAWLPRRYVPLVIA